MCNETAALSTLNMKLFFDDRAGKLNESYYILV